MMMSTIDSKKEKNWNSLQKQLTTNRKKQQQTQNNKQKNSVSNQISYRENPFAPEFMRSKQTPKPGVPNTTRVEKSILKKNVLTNVNSKFNNKSNEHLNETNRSNNFYTPLQTPQPHLITTPSKLNDPYGIYPLAARSPYQSARDPYLQQPNLESWGIQNQSVYDSYRFISSPFLPVYNSITNKPQKPYIIAPKFRRPLFQPPSPIMTDYNDNNTKLNYIATKPYVRPEYSFENTNSSSIKYIKDTSINNKTENEPLKSDLYLNNAHKILKTIDDKKYDGTELFSTKFIEDLEYTFTPATSSKPKKAYQKPDTVKHPAADEYIKNIKKQVNIIIPPRDYQDEPMQSAYAIDLAEMIYKQEIENMTRELVQQAVNEEYNQVYLYQRPLFNQIFEETTSQMIRKLVIECVNEHQKQIEKLQSNEIKKVAKEKLVTNLMLDHMLTKVAQHGRVLAENEDINRLLDGMILEILLHTNIDVRKVRDKTLQNYPIKKFHLNSFMNVSLDILVAELSSNLEEDMRELESYEQITSKI